MDSVIGLFKHLQLWWAICKANISALYILGLASLRGRPITGHPDIKTFERIARLSEEALGRDSPRTAEQVGILGMCYREIGSPEAYPCLQHALELAQRAYGFQHPRVAVALSNLAGVCRLLERVEEAERYYLEALAIDKLNYGMRHEETLTDLSNLALLWYHRNDPARNDQAEARANFRYVQAIDLERYGPNHPTVAEDHLNVSSILIQEKDFGGAEQEIRQALRIYEGLYPKMAIKMANVLGALAAVLSMQGPTGLNEAYELQNRALAIDEQAFGPDHIDVSSDLYKLAIIQALRSNYQQAFDLMKQAFRIEYRLIGQVFTVGAEEQRLAYLKTTQKRLGTFLSLISQHLAYSPSAKCEGVELVLRRKAIGFEAMVAQRDAILRGKYPAFESKLKKLGTLRMQIAQKILSGAGKEGVDSYQEALTKLVEQRTHLETELARGIPEINVEQKLSNIDLKAVASVLPEQTTLVEFIRFEVFDFKAIAAPGESLWKPAHYLAFILSAGEPDNLQMIDLGEAEPTDRMIVTFRETITKEQENRGQRDMGALPSEQSSSANDGADDSAGRALRAALFDPLVDALDGRMRLLIAPDGDLARLPFEVLPTDDGRRLIDDYRISYLGAGRDVLRFGAASSGQSTEPLVIADPDFDLGSIAVPLERGTDSKGMHFNRLPGTRTEGEQIARKLNVQPLLADKALEARLKACRSPRILHLATHGFFLADQPRDPNKEFRDLGAIGWQSSGGVGSLSERMSGLGMENPLLRSGLALAGANTWLTKGNVPAEAEDGILTAEDVSGLDLLATELVVLSACETGLGEIRTGEGVFGLRRAFVLAGAKTLVISLWKVPDQQTQELMTDFYDRILSGQPRADALRDAQLALKKKFPAPLYWGAFICQGNPGPL